MDSDLLKELAKSLATKVNAALDVPLVSEENEQAFFEMIILIVMELIFNRLGFRVAAK